MTIKYTRGLTRAYPLFYDNNNMTYLILFFNEKSELNSNFLSN